VADGVAGDEGHAFHIGNKILGKGFLMDKDE
jgi:hypothetical protein